MWERALGYRSILPLQIQPSDNYSTSNHRCANHSSSNYAGANHRSSFSHHRDANYLKAKPPSEAAWKQAP